MPNIETALTHLLNIAHPILLAPMGGASGGSLAAAVTHAGGLGLVHSGFADAPTVTRELAAAGNARVGAGFMTWSLDQRPEVLQVALAAKPVAVMLSFGDPSPYFRAIHDAGSKVICQVQTLAAAKQAVKLGADIIVAQGRDAGGHTGAVRGSMGFVPAVVDIAGSIPVVAAGGIADGRGVAAALMLGAAGVLMGTRFNATRESLWSPEMKARLIAASGDETELTRVFDIVQGIQWPHEYPGRAISNKFSRQWHGHEQALQAAQKEEQAAYVDSLVNDMTQRAAWAGEGLDLVKDLPAAADVVERIMAEACSALGRAATLLR